jgi:hypothetical protein
MRRGGWEVAVGQGFIFPGGLTDQPKRVIEPELDMSRLRPQQSAAVSRIRVLMRWLIPSMGVTTAPMRSIAREIEEAFPSGER